MARHTRLRGCACDGTRSAAVQGCGSASRVHKQHPASGHPRSAGDHAGGLLRRASRGLIVIDEYELQLVASDRRLEARSVPAGVGELRGRPRPVNAIEHGGVDAVAARVE